MLAARLVVIIAAAVGVAALAYVAVQTM